MNTYIRLGAAAAALCLCAAVMPAAIAADDSGAEAKALLAEIAKAQKDPDRAGLDAAVERVPDVHNGLGNKGLRGKLQAALGKVLRSKTAGNSKLTAAKAFARLDDPDGAFKQLAKAFPKPKEKEAGPSQLEALRSTATLAPKSAIETLLKLMQKGKSLPAVNEAILALGVYGGNKKRGAVLKGMLDVTSRHFAAARSAAQNPKGGDGDRAWKALGPSLIASLNKLTGQNHQTGEAWLEAYKANKKKPAALFTTELD